MPLTVFLQPELEAWITQEATREGVTPAAFVARALDAQRLAVPTARVIFDDDVSLLLEINKGFPESFWDRLRYLRERLEAETLTEEEREEFNGMYAQVEEKNAQRMALLLRLAQLRGVTLPEVMQQLGISSVQAA